MKTKFALTMMKFVFKMMRICIKSDEVCIKNAEVCIKYDEICILRLFLRSSWSSVTWLPQNHHHLSAPRIVDSLHFQI